MFSSISRYVGKLAAAAVIALVMLPTVVFAHPLSASFTDLSLEEDATRMTFSIDVLSVMESTQVDANRDGLLSEEEIRTGGGEIGEWVERFVVLSYDGIGQRGVMGEISIAARGDKTVVAVPYVYEPAQPGQALTLQDRMYEGDGNTSYVNLMTIRQGEGVQEVILRGENRVWNTTLSEAGTAGEETPSGWMQFFVFGMEHILTGYDHLLFLLALLLLRTNFKTYAAIVTSFTVAHSITISLAMLGIVRLPAQWIEIAIALSIVYVAAENIIRKEAKRRWLLTFAFGLIHGLGFANLLIDMTIPPQHLAVSLLSFNLGIEAMQLILVLVALPLLKYVQSTKIYTPAVQLASALLILVGGYWAVERFLGA